MESFQVPPGYHPPFSTVSDNDHTAWILIAASLGTIYSLIFGGIRVFIRYTTSRVFGLDDAVLAVATVRFQTLHTPWSTGTFLIWNCSDSNDQI